MTEEKATPVVIMNSPVVTGWGMYQWSQITPESARQILSLYGFESAIGHESTARFVSRILGVEVPANRRQVKMGDDDFNMALVFRIRTRLPEGAVLSESELEDVEYDLGLLEWYGP